MITAKRISSHILHRRLEDVIGVDEAFILDSLAIQLNRQAFNILQVARIVTEVFVIEIKEKTSESEFD